MYKTLAPGCIGFGKTFKEAAMPAAESGFEGYWFDIHSDSEVDISETRELLDQSKLRAAGFSFPVEFRADEDTYRRDMETLPAFAKYAAAIGANRCVTWIMPGSETLEYAENFEQHRSRLKPAAEIFKDFGISLGLEFIGSPDLILSAKHKFIHDLDRMLELCDAIGTGNCGILVDIWHWDLAGQTRADFGKFTNPDQIVLVHINDAPAGIPKEEQKDSVRKLPGETGVLRIAEFFEGLKSVGYTGPVMPEPFEKKLSSMSFEDALKTVMDSINKVWPD